MIQTRDIIPVASVIHSTITILIQFYADTLNDAENIYVWLAGPRCPVSERQGRRLEILLTKHHLR